MGGAGRMQFTLRPLQGPSPDGAYRISLPSKAFDELKLKTGDICSIYHEEKFLGKAVAWRSKDAQLSKTVIQISDVLKDTFGLKLGETILVEKDESPAVRSDTVYVKLVTNNVRREDEDGNAHWEWLCAFSLYKIGLVAPGLGFETSSRAGERRAFSVVKCTSSEHTAGPARYKFDFTAKVRIIDRDDKEAVLEEDRRPLLIDFHGVGGLRTQIETIQESVELIVSETKGFNMPSYYQRGGGILLVGPPGTGKSLLLEKVAMAPWRSVFRIDSSHTTTAIQAVFADAMARQPSLVMIDDLDTLVRSDHDTTHPGRLALALAHELKNVAGSKVTAIATASRFNGVHRSLRTSATFYDEIELPVPDSAARAEILKAIMRRDPLCPDASVDEISERLHGYVGSDLKQLVMKAAEHALKRYMGGSNRPYGLTGEPNGNSDIQVNGHIWEGPTIRGRETDSGNKGSPVEIEIKKADLEAACLKVRPTAMKEIFLETPRVCWSDIGGQQEVKKTLQTTVEGPFKHPDRMKRLGYENEKGVLLYGPPGCSKTLIAKALATEAGLNFIAVKGAELLSMYVGESERAVREIFRKARNASPSIVFFDEIDAIASSREGPGHLSGLNVLTTLLNEMDGIEETKGILVVAATNKPEVLDKALMRPGRLDLLQYVGPPDEAARKEILTNKTSKMDTATDVDIVELARVTEGCSGAEIVRICNYAGKLAFEECTDTQKEDQILMKHFEMAVGKTPKQITKEMIQQYLRFASTQAT